MTKHAIVVMLPSTLTQFKQMRSQLHPFLTEYLFALQLQQQQFELIHKSPPFLYSLTFLGTVNAHEFLARGGQAERSIAIGNIAWDTLKTQTTNTFEAISQRYAYWEESSAKVATQAFCALLQSVHKSEFRVSAFAFASNLAFWNGNEREIGLVLRAMHIEFVLFRNQDTEPAAQYLVSMFRARKESSNPNCTVRTLDSTDARSMRQIVKEWLYLAAARIQTVLSGFESLCGTDEDNTMEIRLELHSTHLQRTAGSTVLHSGMREMKAQSVVPLSSVQASVICGCPLQATAIDTANTSKTLMETEQIDRIDGSMWFNAARKSNGIKARALGKYLLEADCAMMLQCYSQDGAEYYLCVPSAEFNTKQAYKPTFLLFRVVSAEEILLPPQSKNEEESVSTESEKAEADFDTLSKCFYQMQAKKFNPFDYHSDITLIRPATRAVNDLMTTRRQSHRTQATVCPTNSRLRDSGLPYTPLPIVKKRKQL
ncbi:hypothetical protein ABG067_007195 [Albugo candida]